MNLMTIDAVPAGSFTAELSRVLDIAEALPRPLPPRRRAALAFVYRWLRICMKLGRRTFVDPGVQRARRDYLAARVRGVLADRQMPRDANTVAVHFTRSQRDELDECRIGCQNESRQACIKRLVREHRAYLLSMPAPKGFTP